MPANCPRRSPRGPRPKASYGGPKKVISCMGGTIPQTSWILRRPGVGLPRGELRGEPPPRPPPKIGRRPEMPLSHLLLCLSILATLLPVRAPRRWLSLLIMAGTAGQTHGQLTIAALVPVAAMAALAWMAIAARHRPRREAVLMALMLVIGLALALHLLPGFLTPTYLVAASDTRPPTLRYLNFDKGVAGMLMLAVLAAQQRRRDEGV